MMGGIVGGAFLLLMCVLWLCGATHTKHGYPLPRPKAGVVATPANDKKESGAAADEDDVKPTPPSRPSSRRRRRLRPQGGFVPRPRVVTRRLWCSRVCRVACQ